MSSGRVRKLIFGSLIAALSTWYGVSHLLTGGSPARAQAASAQPAHPDRSPDRLPARASTPPEPAVPERRVLAVAEWPDNPFFRLAPPTPEQNEDANAKTRPEQGWFVLNATASGAQPLAMICGQIVAVGDRLADGSAIIAIDPYSVTLQGPQGAWILKLAD